MIRLAGRKLTILFGSLLLISCATGQLPQQEETLPEVDESHEDSSYIELESGIESDFNFALTLLENSDHEQAIQTLESVIGREQRLVAPFINLAIAYRRSDKDEQAEKHLLKALELDPVHPIANNELGLIYRKGGKFNEAMVVYRLAIRTQPDFAPAHRNLGVLCDLYMHDFECALEQYEIYLTLIPQDRQIPIWIADVKRRVRQ